MKDYLQKAYCYDQTVRIYAAITTNLCEEARYALGLWPTSAAALGRTLTIGAIMGCTYKNNEHLTIRINGNGPIGQILVETTFGKVKGFVHNPEVFLQYSNGKLNVGAGVGNSGFLNVTKDLKMKEPFTSTSELVSGEIAEDFTYYFAKSEQIPSSVGLGVLIDPSNQIIAAGGFLLQIMPGCKEETITKIEETLAKAKPASQMVNEGYSAEDMIKELTNGDYQLLETVELKYACDCSKERFFQGIKTIGKSEIETILKEDGEANVTCHFCNKKYHFDNNDLIKMIEELTPNSEM